MGCPGGCPGSKSTGSKAKSSMPKNMSGRSTAKTYASSNTLNSFGKPKITFSAKNR